MKRILLVAGFATVAGVATGHAADLATRPYAKAPVMVDTAYNWTGFYIGATAGGAWSKDAVGLNVVNGATPLYNPQDIPTLGALGSTSIKGSNAVFGGKLGYNVQVSSFVIGLESDLSYFRFNRATTLTGNPFTLGGVTWVPGFGTFNETASTSWLATVRGRVGYAADRLLVYGTGGAAFADVKFSNTYVGFSPHGSGNEYEASSAGQTKVGWAAGAGIEYALTTNWILSGEYLHVDLGSMSTSGLVTTGGLQTATFNFSTKLTSDIVRAGISYKFGGPIVARY